MPHFNAGCAGGFRGAAPHPEPRHSVNLMGGGGRPARVAATGVEDAGLELGPEALVGEPNRPVCVDTEDGSREAVMAEAGGAGPGGGCMGRSREQSRGSGSCLAQRLWDRGLQAVGMWRSSEEATKGPVGQKLLMDAVEQLPGEIREGLASCMGPLAGTAAEGSARAGLLSMLLMDPRVLLWQLQAGLSSLLLVVDDAEEELWAQGGQLTLCEYSKFIPERRRKEGQPAAKPEGPTTELELGSGTQPTADAFKKGLMASMTRCSAALAKSDLQRHRPAVWRRSELGEVGPYFAVLHPLEVLMAVYGQQMTPRLVQTAASLFGSLAYVAEAEYVEDWKQWILPVYATVDADGEVGEAASVVWTSQSSAYGRAHVGPAECPLTDHCDTESSLTATTAKDGWESDAEEEMDGALGWALQQSAEVEAAVQESRRLLQRRVVEYAESLGRGLLEVAPDGNCLPAVVAYYQHGDVGLHHTARQDMQSRVEAALEQGEEWVQHVLREENESFRLPGRYGQLEHAVAAAHVYQWRLSVHLLPAGDGVMGAETEVEPTVRECGPQACSGEHLEEHAVLFDGVGHWYGLVDKGLASELTERRRGGYRDTIPLPRIRLPTGGTPGDSDWWYAVSDAQQDRPHASPGDSDSQGDVPLELELGEGEALVPRIQDTPETRGAVDLVSVEQSDSQLGVDLTITDGSTSSDSDAGSWLALRAQGEEVARERFTKLKKELRESRSVAARLEEQLGDALQRGRDQDLASSERDRVVAEQAEQLEELRSTIEALTAEHENERVAAEQTATQQRQEAAQLQGLADKLKAKLKEDRAAREQLERDRHEHQLALAEQVRRQEAAHAALQNERQVVAQLEDQVREAHSQVAEALKQRKLREESEAEMERCRARADELQNQVSVLEAEVPGLRKAQVAAENQERLWREQLARAQAEVSTESSGSVGSTVDGLRAELAAARGQARSAKVVQQTQREQCTQLVGQLVEMQAQMEELREELDEARSCDTVGGLAQETPSAPQSDTGWFGAAVEVKEAVERVRQLSVDLDRSSTDTATKPTTLQLMGQLLGGHCHAGLEHRLRQHWGSTGKRQVPQLEELAKELWGPGPKEAIRELQQGLTENPGWEREVQQLQMLQELDARRTLALDQLLWVAGQPRPVMELPAPKPGSAQSPGVVARAAEIDKLEKQLAKRGKELRRLEREVREGKDQLQAKEEDVAKQSRLAAECTGAKRQLEEENRLLRRRLEASRKASAALEQARSEVLEMEARLNDKGFELERLQVRFVALQGQHQNAINEMQGQHQNAVAAAEGKGRQQLEALQRQLQLQQGQAAAQTAAAARAEETLQRAEDQLEAQAEALLQAECRGEEVDQQLQEQVERAQQLEAELQQQKGLAEKVPQLEEEAQRWRERAQALEAGGQSPVAAATPARVATPWPQRRVTPLQDSRWSVPVAAEPVREEPAQWLLWTHQDPQSGVISNRVVAWVVGKDGNGVAVAAEYRDAEASHGFSGARGDAVNAVAWWAAEAEMAGDHLFRVSTRTAAQLDSTTSEPQLRQYQAERGPLLPGLAQEDWTAMVAGTPCTPAHGVTAAVRVGDSHRVEVLGTEAAATVIEMLGGAVALQLPTSWVAASRVLEPHVLVLGVGALGLAPGTAVELGAQSLGFTSTPVSQLAAAAQVPGVGLAHPISGVGPATAPLAAQAAHSANPTMATAHSGGSALTQQLSITTEERMQADGWPAAVAKAKHRMDPRWKMDQFTSDEDVRDQVRQLREFLQARALDRNRTTQGLAYGAWKLLSVNSTAARTIKGWFRVNEQNVAVGQNRAMDVGNWLDSIFQELTGVNYQRLGRVQQMEAFGLPESWKLGTARRCVQGWVECVQDEPLKRTWCEAEAQVLGLLKATGFHTAIEKIVLPPVEEAYLSLGPGADAAQFWSTVQDVLVQVLEVGVASVFYEWKRFRAAPLSYHGPYDFSEVLVHGQRVRQELPAPAGGGRSAGYRSKQTGPSGPRVCVMGEEGFLPYEEAIKYQLEPCGFHADLLMKNPANKHSREELLANMHCYGACLRTDNPMRECTLLGPGGVDAMLRRERMPKNDPQRKQLWKDQQREVWKRERQLKEASGARIALLEQEEQLHENEENEVCGVVGTYRLCLLVEEEGQCA